MLLADYVDDSAPVGEQHYALILKSQEQSSQPIRASLIVPKPPIPPRPQNLSARSVPGYVELQWSDDIPISLHYHVYRGKPGAGQFKRLTSEPTAALHYRDESARPGVEYDYAVRAVSRHGIESPASETSQAAALSEIKEAVFVAAFTKDADASLHSGSVAQGTLHSESRVAAGALDLSAGGHATFAHQQTFDLDHSLSVECWVNMTEDGQMPVVVSCGRWNEAGWFLQRFGSGWRWHVGGINCDGGPPSGGSLDPLAGNVRRAGDATLPERQACGSEGRRRVAPQMARAIDGRAVQRSRSTVSSSWTHLEPAYLQLRRLGRRRVRLFQGSVAGQP